MNQTEKIEQVDQEIYQAIIKEQNRQNNNIELIASENFTSTAVMEAQGSVLTNKYAEGYPEKRYYGGCEFVDIVENLAIERAKKIFGCEYVNVQPHSGSSANMAVYLSVLNIGDTILGMDLSCGGHLTHGHPMNFSGKYFNIVPYKVNKKTELIDYDELEKLAITNKPKMIISGASAYSRAINFERIKEICDKVNAYMMVDIAHIAGLVAANLHTSPVPYADFVTTTTHKTLRGPRGGMIMAKEKYKAELNRTIFPGIQGGPLMHVIAGKAVALKEAMTEKFKLEQQHVINNAQTLANELKNKGYRIVSGGTDNHLLLVDVMASKNITGKNAEKSLDQAGITTNKNTIPYDTQKPFIASGIRLGTPVVTTRGMREPEMKLIAEYINEALINQDNKNKLSEIKNKVKHLCNKFPLYY
ncbi:MAG: serine hydroxymethyltransferase [bacterium]|nr:serine hydroxymethyltransferase [bacterium]